MLPLRELQALFLRSIATTSDRSDDHRFHPELLELVDARGVLGATQRLGIYAEMYWARLLDVLRDDFPRVAAIVGDDRFTTLAAAYLERHPSTNPSVRWVGGDFAVFLTEHGPVDEHPFLADLARLEWTRLAVFDAADAVPLRLVALRAMPPSTWPRLIFQPVPALRVLRCAWPVHELWPADDPKAAATTMRPAATVLRVWREAFAVYQARVDTVEQLALQHLLAGAPFGVMCDRLEALLPPPAVAREAGALILRWVEDQILASPLTPSRRGRTQ